MIVKAEALLTSVSFGNVKVLVEWAGVRPVTAATAGDGVSRPPLAAVDNCCCSVTAIPEGCTINQILLNDNKQDFYYLRDAVHVGGILRGSVGFDVTAIGLEEMRVFSNLSGAMQSMTDNSLSDFSSFDVSMSVIPPSIIRVGLPSSQLKFCRAVEEVKACISHICS